MKVPFGLSSETNKFLGIDQVVKGLECNCICPSCKMQLIAKKGSENEHHFAHYREAENACNYSYYVAVRSMAKQLAIKHQNIYIDIEDDAIHSLSPFIDLFIYGIEECRNSQYDLRVESSIGTFFVFFVTGESEERSPGYPRTNNRFFSDVLVLDIDMSDLRDYNNVELGDTIYQYLFLDLLNKDFVSASGSFVGERKRVELKDKLRRETEERNRRFRDGSQRVNTREARDVVNSPRENQDPTKSPMVRKMLGFAKKMKESYSYEDKKSETFKIVYKGKYLWFVSFNNQFYTAAWDGTYVLYEVVDGEIDILGNARELEDLEVFMNKPPQTPTV